MTGHIFYRIMKNSAVKGKTGKKAAKKKTRPLLTGPNQGASEETTLSKFDHLLPDPLIVALVFTGGNDGSADTARTKLAVLHQ
jgi:hypothetical protein